MVTAKKGLLQKAGKALGTVGNVLGILDAVNMVDKVSGHAAPLIDKAIDRHYDSKKDMVSLQDLSHLPLDQARQILEELGFIVAPILLKPDKKYASQTVGEVLRMIPRSGQLRRGSVVKLYHIDQTNLILSQDLLADQERKTKELVQKMTDGLNTAKKVIQRPKKAANTSSEEQTASD